MYDKLDGFLKVETWHTGHPYDVERFNQALHSIVTKPNFNADDMADYIRDKVGVADSDESHPLADAIDKLQSSAWAVREYLQANKLI